MTAQMDGENSAQDSQIGIRGGSSTGGASEIPANGVSPNVDTANANLLPAAPPASPTDTSQGSHRAEIHIHNVLPPEIHPWSAKIVIPWVIGVVGWVLAIIFYRLNRTNKIYDDLTEIVLDDVKIYLEKLEELGHAVASHQSGNPTAADTLGDSRKAITRLRQAAQGVSDRITLTMHSEADVMEWKRAFRDWKIAIEGQSNLITNKRLAWTSDRMVLLDEANTRYTSEVCKFRTRIASRKLKLSQK